jgi:hypothetical protein
MGYETRIHVVALYGHGIGLHDNIETGEELASIDLCKCGYEGAVADLIAKSHKDAKEAKIKFGLWARTPDRNDEAVEILRQLAEDATSSKTEGSIEDRTTRANFLTELSNHIEDSAITEDKYGDNLGVIDIDDFIAALEEDYEKEEYRRFKWAIDLLKSIKESYKDIKRDVKVITYGH